MTDKTLLEILDEHARSVEELRLNALEMSANVNIVLDELDRLRAENRQLKAEKLELKLHADNLRYMINKLVQGEPGETIQ
jgi:predicted nuclease with TOPRIM domain